MDDIASPCCVIFIDHTLPQRPQFRPSRPQLSKQAITHLHDARMRIPRRPPQRLLLSPLPRIEAAHPRDVKASRSCGTDRGPDNREDPMTIWLKVVDTDIGDKVIGGAFCHTFSENPYPRFLNHLLETIWWPEGGASGREEERYTEPGGG